ncbi:MAG: MBL fold metallo-hydrolase [Armatimonadetes bacterium]|nr:MBL fold metallo-hydrolase [Armatimonadota bacterium]
MLRLTVLGGAGEIGGNKILLEDRGAGLLLDFGISYRRRGMFFEEYLNPRTAAGLTDLLVTGVLPAAPGLYRHDLLEMLKRDGHPDHPQPGALAVLPLHDEPAAAAVLLSHAHLDHAGHVSFLDERIPVYCSGLTHATIEAMTQSRGRDFETEILNFLSRPALPPYDDAVPRRFEAVEDEFEAGGISCRALPVDHSMLGAVAFLVRTSRGNILYTGDLRFHGPEAHLSEAMLESAAAEGVWMLITEGTRLDATERRTEDDVFAECLEAVRGSRGPVIADFAPRDLYRLSTFLGIAKETGRSLVILPQDALLLEHLHGRHPLVPDPRREPILILKERKASGTYRDQDYATWERQVLRWPTAGTARDLRSSRSSLILALSFWDINNLIDLGVGDGDDALFIHSASEAYSEEQAADERRLGNWLNLLGVRARLRSHASGHACQADLVRMARRLRPEILVPVHTEAPGLWSELVPEVQVVEPEAGVEMRW